MTNLVLGAAIGYKLDKIKPFILSLRKHYHDKVILLIDKVDEESRSFFNENNIQPVLPSEYLDPKISYVIRFNYFLQILKNEKQINNVFISDVRDVVFQEDPFERYMNNDLEFFAEPEFIGKCNHNGPWISSVYGIDQFNKLKDEYVICVGTTAGKYSSMLDYLEQLVGEFGRLYRQGKAHSTCDQAMHMYLIYNQRFKNYRINQNGKGMVSTMHHSKLLKFDRKGRLLNDDNTVTPVVHQYDRCGALSIAFLKNCFSLSGKEAILHSSNYATNNFNEWDL